jgi:hypothetical protein
MGEILESIGTILGDSPDHKIAFSTLGIKTMRVWTIGDDRIYIITYVAEEVEDFEDFQLAERTVQSFETEE